MNSTTGEITYNDTYEGDSNDSSDSNSTSSGGDGEVNYDNSTEGNSTDEYYYDYPYIDDGYYVNSSTLNNTSP